jgi:hypothetical protein
MQGFHPCTPPKPFLKKGFGFQKTLNKYLLLKFFDPNFCEAKETFISRKFGGVWGSAPQNKNKESYL